MHIPVLLEQATQGLAIQPQGIYIDGTFGRGGHSQAILARLNTKGRLIVLDKDPTAIAIARERYAGDQRVSVIHDSFAHLDVLATRLGILGKVNGILLDLGVSSPQLDDATRGFSFSQSGPLDMRMDPQQGIAADEWIAKASAAQMAEVFKKYGEERYAKRIANAIVAERTQQPIKTTAELAAIVKRAHPAWERHKHPATRVFQAIRIYINHELEGLEQFLACSNKVLAVGGRLVIISFHSLEDRLVKRFFRKQAQRNIPRDIPITQDKLTADLRVVGKVITPDEHEVRVNLRARSAKLRIAEKVR